MFHTHRARDHVYRDRLHAIEPTEHRSNRRGAVLALDVRRVEFRAHGSDNIPMQMEPKTVAETALTMAVMMLPGDANPHGQVHGGAIMKLVDTAAAAVAHRHARSHVATARVDSMSFLAPVEVGDLVTFKASVNAVWHTSMEIGVRVESENLLSGKVTHTSSAYLVLVAVDNDLRPRPVPPLLTQTPDEQRRHTEAEERRARRLATRTAPDQGM